MASLATLAALLCQSLVGCSASILPFHFNGKKKNTSDMLAVSLGNQHWRRNDLPGGFSGEGHFLLKYAKGLVLHMCMEFPL